MYHLRETYHVGALVAASPIFLLEASYFLLQPLGHFSPLPIVPHIWWVFLEIVCYTNLLAQFS